MVVRNSYLKIIWREFKSSFGRFAAIFGIVALGVGFLSGLLVTTPDMHNSVDEYYDKHNMADIFIKATMGLTEEDLEKVKEIENIKDVMPAYVMDKLLQIDSKGGVVAKIYGLPLLDYDEENTINRLELFEGRMPRTIRECLVEREGSHLEDIKIGTKLKISKENKDYEDIDDLYDVKEYKVVGIVGNSFHFSMEREASNVGSGKLGTIVYVDKEAYALEEYTDFYIVADNALKMNSFASRYQDYIEKIREELESFGEKRSLIRKEEILDTANEELKDGYKEYYEGKEEADKELSDAKDKINKGKKELEKSLVDIETAEMELIDARKTLDKENKKAIKEIERNEKNLEKAKVDLIKGEEELKASKLELENGEEEYQKGLKEYLKGKEQLEKADKEFIKGEKEFLAGEKNFLEAKEELNKGKRESAKAKISLQEAEVKYKKGIAELKAGKTLFLSSIKPIADNIGYPSAEALISTESGRGVLRGYLRNAKQELIQALNEARAGKVQVENNINLLNQNKSEIIAQLAQLKAQSQNPDLDEQELQVIVEQIRILEEQLASIEQNLDNLSAQLVELNSTIPYLEEQLNILPEYDFLIQQWNTIKENESRLESAKQEIDFGWAEYKKGLQQLQVAEKELAIAEREIQKGRKELEKNRKELAKAKKELEDGFKELELAKKELEKGNKEYNKGLLAINDGWKDYYKGKAELENARITLENEMDKAIEEIEVGEEKLAKGQKEYENGIKDIEEAEREYKKAKEEVEEELDDAYAELMDAEEEIRDLEDPEWYVLDRSANMSYVSFDLNADKVAAISRVFPIFFYLVAGLVALTTMTRMVEEERTQIGVLKALGYNKLIIIFKYLLYSGLASILGSIAGQIVGFKVIPRVLWNAYGVMYHLPEFLSDYNTRIALLSSGMAIISTVVATYFSANGALKEKPANLMLPRAPKSGKRILLERIKPLWSILSFNQKSTARNIFRYKKHFYMTVIGVSGCTALLVAGFGLRDSIKDIGTLQFEELFQHELEIELEEDFPLSDIDKIIGGHPEILENLEVFSDRGYIEYQGRSIETTLVAVEEMQDFSGYVVFRDRKKGEIIETESDEIVISEKVAEVLGIKEGNTIIYENFDEKKREFQVDVITENYLDNYIYLKKSIYEDVYNEKQENKTIYIKTGELENDEKDELIKELYGKDGVLNAEFISERRGLFDNLIMSINYIVGVIIISSGLLAFIVLYNLTNININERRRELATLKVLGFHNEEVSAYIFREITILSIIGTLVGLLLGKYLHQFIVLTVENPNFMFGRDISWLSYLLSSIITLVFSVIVDLFMVKKLINIKMVDSLKAND